MKGKVGTRHRKKEINSGEMDGIKEKKDKKKLMKFGKKPIILKILKKKYVYWRRKDVWLDVQTIINAKINSIFALDGF